jgi:glucokinase
MELLNAPNPKRAAIGMDIGGTKIAAGVVRADGQTLEVARPIATPTSTDAMVEALKDLVEKLRLGNPDVDAVGVGAAGLVEWPSGHIRYAPNNSYHDLPLRRLLEESLSLPTIVDNDANAAAWAEAQLGQPNPYMMFLTVGTGVGGGLVLANELYRGASGLGGEVGHLVVDPYGSEVCGCGNIGCLEAVASGTALRRYGQQAALADPSGTIAMLAEYDLDQVTGRTVYQAARHGDAMALTLLRKVGNWLGIGIASLVNALELQQITVGGSVANADELLLEPIKEGLRRHLFAAAHRNSPVVGKATLGTEAGWVGAGLLALHTTSP